MNQYNNITAALVADPATFINASTYANCKNATSIGYYGVVPLSTSLNFNKPSANPTQHLKSWVDNLNLTKPAKRVRTVTAIANMRDGYINGVLVDPSLLMSQNIPVTISKTYPGTTKKVFQWLITILYPVKYTTSRPPTGK